MALTQELMKDSKVNAWPLPIIPMASLLVLHLLQLAFQAIAVIEKWFALVVGLLMTCTRTYQAK
eukprot:15361654-Ditylum_brightwellii.AAC.1